MTAKKTIDPLDELEALLARKKSRAGKSRLTREQQDERAKESAHRGGLANGYALAALRTLHPDDYDRLLIAAKAKIIRDRGPLPYQDLLDD